MKTKTKYTCGFCEGRHASNRCPWAGPDDVPLVDVVMDEMQTTSKFAAYNKLQRERSQGIDSFATRGLRRLGPEQPEGILGNGGGPALNHKSMILQALLLAEKEVRSIKQITDFTKEHFDWYSDHHNVAHVLWSLQKEGLVRFTARNRNGKEILDHITLRPAGRARAEAERDVEKWAKTEASVTLPIIDEKKTDTPKTAGTPGTETVTALRTDVRTEPSIADQFPLIAELAARQNKLTAAAKLLEQAGQDELAIAVLEKNVYTDFEKEVVRLWRQCKERS